MTMIAEEVNNLAQGKAAPYFSARLTPHRSLGPKGFLVLMALVSGVSFTAGLFFWMVGAWPVFFFFGLDVALVYWAFRANYRAARAWEQVEVADDRLTVERGRPGHAPRLWTFHPYWVRVELEEWTDEDEGLALCGPLTLRSHGNSLEIGAFLSPDERRDFARTLRNALSRRGERPNLA
jgi:uncharacterized membrane protein